jgi:pimeloyl-ACP methyl ester carboxylesterase
MFDGWANDLSKERSGLDEAALRAFRARMYDGDFVFSVTRDFVRGCRTPLLVLAGNDLYHPTPVAQEIADLAPNAELIMKWKTPDAAPAAVARVRTFLKAHQ